MKNDRLGLLMIFATMVVIAIMSGLLYRYQTKIYDDKTRVNGVALTRALSTAEYAQLVPENGQGSLARSLINVQDNDSFAYVAVVNLGGDKLLEITSAGSIVPEAIMPNEPFAWFGEHTVASPGDDRKVREFFAPVMKEGQLAGFIRAGYFNKQSNMLSSQISSLGMMALPIFLLTTLSYFLIRREIKPLGQLSKKIEQASLSYGVQVATPLRNDNMGDFIQRFDQFIQIVQSKVNKMDRESFSSRTGAHLIAFKQEKAESALNSIPDAILVIDEAAIPTFANPKLEPILGVRGDEIIGRLPSEWCTNKDILEFILRFKGNPKSMRPASIEYTPENNAEQKIFVSAYPLFSPRDHNTLLGMLIVFRDISNEYRAKQAGTTFVSQVSHELKTPLNTIALYSEMLLDHAFLPEAEKVAAINVIHSEVERMAALINNLLNISQMESGSLQLVRKRVKLHDLMQEAFDSMRNNALGKGIALELKIPPDLGSVRLDKGLFRIAIDNLLSNAIKYSNPGGKVTVSAKNLDDDQMQICVRDQGIGISPEETEKIFLKFFRSNNSETATRTGHGLGLYLAKQIILLHHGTIAVNSEIGKGTEFIITFKAQPVQLEETQTV